MKEFASLVKRKDKALSIFTEAKENLKKVLSDLASERDKSFQAVVKETERQQYLSNEMNQVSSHIANIEKVIG